VVTTSVFDRADDALSAAAPAAACRVCRVGLLGLGTVGSAFARLCAERESAALLASRELAPLFIASALVRTPSRPRDASPLVALVTGDADDVFAEPPDVIVEALGGVEPAYTLVRRALELGIPVVTANKSLVAARGDALTRLAHRRGTTIRCEASCIAGVPFLGTFERRPLAARASSITAILNGTSNAILTAMGGGASFDAALADAQRRGLAEPDPWMDVSGADAAEKLAILVRLFGQLAVAPSALPVAGIDAIDQDDIAAASAFDGAIRPVAHAAWADRSLRAFVGPAFLGAGHPLSRARGVTNGIAIAGAGGTQCFTGPGAGPDVTAATLLDDVVEILRNRRTDVPSTVHAAGAVARPETPWLLRLTGSGRDADVADLLGSFGIWTTRLSRRGDRRYALTCGAAHGSIASAIAAVDAAAGRGSAAFPAIVEDDAC
jgi:homoserine dehydrogenase